MKKTHKTCFGKKNQSEKFPQFWDLNKPGLGPAGWTRLFKI